MIATFRDEVDSHEKLISALNAYGKTRIEAISLMNQFPEILRMAHSGHWPLDRVADELLIIAAKPLPRRRRN